MARFIPAPPPTSPTAPIKVRPAPSARPLTRPAVSVSSRTPEAEARRIRIDVECRICEVRARFARPVASAPSATSAAHDVQRRILEVRTRFAQPVVGISPVTRPTCPTSLAPYGVPLIKQHDSLSCLTSPTLSRVAPSTPMHPVPPTSSPSSDILPKPRHLLANLPPVISPRIDAPTRAKTFSYTCQYCGDNDHWSKDCPDPHRFDTRYYSVDELRKALDDKLKAESLPPSGPPKDEDNIIPVQAIPAQPELEIPPTLSTPSLEENPPCTSDPLGAAPLETLVSSRRLPKGGAIVRATSSYLTLLPILAPCVPTLCLVERPYIPPDPRTYRNTLDPMGSFHFRPRLTMRWCISTMRPPSLR